MPEIDFEARRPWLDAHLDALVASGARLLLVEVGTEIGTEIGTEVSTGAGTAPAGFVTVDPARGHLDQLAVHPDHGGTGVADRLMAAAKALSPGGLTLDVNAANARARRFYARHGFVAVSEGRNPRSNLPTLSLRWAPR